MNISLVEQLLMTAVGVALFLLFLLRGLNRILLWMDSRDWILIPSKQGMESFDSRLGRAFAEIQAVAQPEKKRPVETKDAAELKRDEDDEGDRPPR